MHLGQNTYKWKSSGILRLHFTCHLPMLSAILHNYSVETKRDTCTTYVRVCMHVCVPARTSICVCMSAEIIVEHINRVCFILSTFQFIFSFQTIRIHSFRSCTLFHTNCLTRWKWKANYKRVKKGEIDCINSCSGCSRNCNNNNNNNTNNKRQDIYA